jgi:uncharacterized protein
VHIELSQEVSLAAHYRFIAFGVLLGSAIVPAPCFSQTASYAPINCTKAATPAEKAICASYELGQDEARLATLYGLLTSLVAMGQRGDIIDAQQKWIVVRSACGNDIKCLSQAYQARIGSLAKQFDALAKRGPF